MTERRRILVVTLDTLAERMAGPAIRAFEIARALGREHDVRLLTFGGCSREGEGFETARTTVEGFRAEVEAADVVVVQGYVVSTFDWLQDSGVVLVVDLYDPFHLESLEVERFRPAAERHAALARALTELGAQARRGDLFLCASDKQRDLWIGHLAAAGRVNPDTYDADTSLRSLITVVPFGMDAAAPVQRAHGIKGAVDGIAADDPVILWGGGVYNWFDPLTVIRAVDRVREAVPNVRLYFLGMKHPNPDVPEMAMAVRTRELSDELGLSGRHVFFNEDWVPYERRADYLLDADVGVSAHFDHVETAFSFRTRILDYLWAGLPIVCTDGDHFGALVTAEDLGAAVPAEDVGALADALSGLLTDEARAAEVRAAVGRVAEAQTWEHALAPLVEFCRDPRRSADAERLAAERAAGVEPGQVSRATRLRADAGGAWRTLRRDGVGGVARKVRRRLGR
ncbi:glycosyltransferase family 4 protein [Georgenia sp. Z1491]|uniref:glycosyltransferase family 4 protein n=1 Tax=Georgenia sp. Z1491 TaxID=3416707 RepID=UPI003CF21034